MSYEPALTHPGTHMKPPRGVAVLRALRAQPTWRLIAAHNAPIIISTLQELFADDDKTIAASILFERLSILFDALRISGEDLPQGAQAYVADWLSEGWLVRRLPPGASEEQYELSNDAIQAIRFTSSMQQRRPVATESRLSSVMLQLTKLAEETDPNPETRVAALVAERARITEEIGKVRTRGVEPLSDERALERAREIIVLADELAADFRRVRSDFDQLNRGLRQNLLEYDGSRGDVLEALFQGVDVIGESEAGKTFSAFWRMLTDPEQAEALREALDAVGRRRFIQKLGARERKFLLGLTILLLDEGGNVHDVLQSFARSLKSFVQSREFVEQRRLHALLREAKHAALGARMAVRSTHRLDYELTLTSGHIRSVSQGSPYDPADRMRPVTMRIGEASEVDLSLVAELVRQSEIDFRQLRKNVRFLLNQRPRVSIADVLESFPAEQGFGSIVGYVALGAKHGKIAAESELVGWEGRDSVRRRAKIPLIYFAREHQHELAD